MKLFMSDVTRLLGGAMAIAFLGTATIMAVLAAVFAASAMAAQPNLNQPVAIGWTQAPAFYEYGQKVTYKFTITSASEQVHYVHVYVESYADPAKIYPTSSIARVYRIRPHSNPLTVTFQAYAPDSAVFDGPMFYTDAVVTAEGYPEQKLSAVALHDSGK